MPSRTREILAVAVAALGAAAYVALGSWHVSLWYDEAASLAAARRDLPDLVAMTRHVDAVHGLYYALLHTWLDLVGASPLTARLPSAVAIGVALAGTYVLGRRLGGRPLAIAAAAMLLVLPRVTWAGIEARSTALTIAAAVWLTVLFVRALDRPRVGRWIAYGVLLALAGWLDIFLVLLVPAHAVTAVLLRARRPAWTGYLASAGAGLLACAPILLESRAQSAQLGGVRLPLTAMIRSVGINQWFLGATPTEGADGGGSSSGLGASDVLTKGWLAAALVLALVGWALVVLAVLPRHGDRPWHRPGVAVALPWLVVPSVVAIAWSVVATPVYHQRYLAFCAPALALLMGAGLLRLRRRLAIVLVSVVLVVASVVVFWSQRTETAKNAYAWSRVAEVVADHREPGDAVYYGPRTPPAGSVARTTSRLIADAYPEAFHGLDDVTLRTEAVPGGLLAATSSPLASVTDRLDEVDGLWVIRWADYPADATADEDRALRAAGLTPERTWVESTSVVTRWVRR